MKKIISFSLWGNNPKYTIGAVRNAELALTIYPEWICRFYIGKSVDDNIIEKIKSLENTEVFLMDEQGSWNSMFWRFFPASEDDVEIMISRDTDSRLSLREKSTVDEWLNSDKGFHIIRDHPWHSTEILGGMWGVKKGVIENIKKLIENFEKNDVYDVDQSFLRKIIYPLVKNNSLVHDEFFNYNVDKKAISLERMDYEFIGDVFDENDKRDKKFWKILQLQMIIDTYTLYHTCFSIPGIVIFTFITMSYDIFFKEQ